MTSTDRDALVALYDAAGGADWDNGEHWNTDTDVSHWHGVQVVGGRVVKLFLPNNNLQGTSNAHRFAICLTFTYHSLAKGGPFLKM